MFIQAQIPRTRMAITPNNVRYVCLDSTPNRQQLNKTQRIYDQQSNQFLNDYKTLIINSNKDNLTRIPANSFSQTSNSKELQIQIQELTSQKDSIQYTLQEAIKKNNFLEQQLNQSNNLRNQYAIQFQLNMDQFQNQIYFLTNKLHDLIQQNNLLQEQYLSQQFYIQELQFQENEQFNITHNFGQM